MGVASDYAKVSLAGNPAASCVGMGFISVHGLCFINMVNYNYQEGMGSQLKSSCAYALSHSVSHTDKWKGNPQAGKSVENPWFSFHPIMQLVCIKKCVFIVFLDDNK